MPASKSDLYSVLGVMRDATQEDIKHAYLAAAQRLHPDKNVALGETELFLEIQQAYETLSNPKRRSQYDATLPKEVIEKNPFIRHSVLFSRPNLVKVEEEQLLYVLLEVEPEQKEAEALSAPPLNICLVLDRSTSMSGEKMDMLKATAIQLIRSLRPQDVLSIVAFSDRAEVIVPASISLDKRKQESNIQMVQPSGGTEIYRGLEAGFKEIMSARDENRVNHIILLTDGETYGDEQKCLDLAEQAAAFNIGISGMGLGHEWNDIFLDSLASKTGGSSFYISQPKDIERYLMEKFKALANIYADDALLEFTEQAHVRLTSVFRTQPEVGQIEVQSPLHLGVIPRDLPLQVLLEFIIEADALKRDKVLIMDALLKVSIAANRKPASPSRLRLILPLGENASSEAPPQIIKALSRLTLYRMQERAQVAVQNGKFEEASRHLQNLATHLLSQGEHAVAKTALLEAQNLEAMNAWSESGSKDVKYKTRALLLGSGREKAL